LPVKGQDEQAGHYVVIRKPQKKADRIKKVSLYEHVHQQANECRRKEYNKDISSKGAGIFTARNHFDHADELFPVLPEDREDRTERNEDLEGLGLFSIETDEVAGENQVAR